MQNVYSKISAAIGPHLAGICQIKIAPIEWMNTLLIIDFLTGSIKNNVSFIAGKNFISLELIPETYDYIEKPKTNKQGSFYEISLSANTNNISVENLQILNTYRHHQFILLAKNKQGQLKLIGNKDAGMIFNFGNKETNNNGGTQLVTVDFNMDLEDPAPFYAP